MKKIFLIIFAIIITFLPASSAPKEEDTQWQKITEYNYIDTDGIMGLEDIYGFSFILKSYNKGQYEPVNGRQISYTLGQYTIDCAKHKYKIGVLDSYGKNDNFINGDYNRYAMFQPIVQGTAVSEVSKMLCKF
jgi:hypothetical protein